MPGDDTAQTWTPGELDVLRAELERGQRRLHRGQQTVGREAIRELWEKILPQAGRFEPEPPLPTLVSGDIALTSTPPKDGAGARAQVVRRQPDGSWLRLLDQPEFIQVSG